MVKTFLSLPKYVYSAFSSRYLMTIKLKSTSRSGIVKGGFEVLHPEPGCGLFRRCFRLLTPPFNRLKFLIKIMRCGER